MTTAAFPRTALREPRTYAGRWPRLVEALVRNNGPELTLHDGTVIEAGTVAVVDTGDPVAAVELLFGRLERNPVLTHAQPWPRGHDPRATALNDVPIDGTLGVYLP